MASPRDTYIKELHKGFGYFATWHPGEPIEIGDVGILRGNLFTRLTNVKDTPVGLVAVRPDNTAEDLSYVSERGVKIAFKAAGKPAWPGSAIADARAGVAVEFERTAGVVFNAVRTTTPSISDQADLGRKIIAAWKAGQWEKDWVVITELVHAASATVIISNTGSSRIELEAAAGIKAAAFNLAEASLGLEVVNQNNIHTQIIGAAEMRPLFKAKGIRSILFSPPRFGSRRVTALDHLAPAEAANLDEGSIYFGDMDYEQIADD